MSTAIKGSILTRAAQGDNVCVLSGASLSRQLGFGVAWTHIRVGIRYNARQPIGSQVNISYSGFRTANTPSFGLGFSAANGQTRSAASSYWVGAISRGGVWTLTDQGSEDYLVSFPEMRAASAQGGLFSIGGNFTAQMDVGCGAQAAIKFLRTMFFVDLIKNAGNFDVKIFFTPSPHQVTDATRASFMTQMVANPPSLVNYTYSAAQSITNNEASFGTLNSVNVFYARTGPEFELQDIAMARLA